jgi:hypothetical protein
VVSEESASAFPGSANRILRLMEFLSAAQAKDPRLHFVRSTQTVPEKRVTSELATIHQEQGAYYRTMCTLCRFRLTSTTNTNSLGSLQFAHEDASLSAFQRLF